MTHVHSIRLEEQLAEQWLIIRDMESAYFDHPDCQNIEGIDDAYQVVGETYERILALQEAIEAVKLYELETGRHMDEELYCV